MLAPDMRAHIRGLIGETVTTFAMERPNTIVSMTEDRVLVETATGDRNHASMTGLQALADRTYEGEEVTVPTRGRSAFHVAVLAGLPHIAYAVNPRRLWLREAPTAFDAEYVELFPAEELATVSEGRVLYRQHRVRERSPALRRSKVQQVLETTGRLACEVCEFDYAAEYGEIGDGFIECHHKYGLGDHDERETAVDDLALVCSSCHRMFHRSRPMMSVDELREERRRHRDRCPPGR